MEGCGLDWSDLGQGSMEGSSGRGNEPLCSLKHWEILERLSDWWLLKKDSAAWSYTWESIVIEKSVLILKFTHVMQNFNFCVVYECMCTFLVLKQSDKSYLHLVMTSLSVIHQCPVKVNIFAPKIGTLQMRLMTKLLFSEEQLLKLWLCFNNLWRSCPKIK
jgi:hypothetical protein